MALKTGLFLTGGGARGAYQAGVMKALAEITPNHELPVDILSGVSTGAINSAFIGSYAEDFNQGTRELVRVWSQMETSQVFESDNLSLLESVWRTLWDVVLHRLPPKGQYLLDTAPLRRLINHHINFDNLNRALDNDVFRAFIITALNYETSESVSFFNSTHTLNERERFRYRSERTPISCDHIMASAAIPIFFPSAEVNGIHYGDGSLRNYHPLRSCIELGVDKILIVSVKKEAQKHPPIIMKKGVGVSFGNIISMVFNSIFLDSIELDLEMMDYINQNINELSRWAKKKIPFRNVDTMIIRPSEDLGKIALTEINKLPKLLRYLLGGFGSKRQSSDMFSYLMFDAEYCQRLINLGYKDTMKRRDEVFEFLRRS